MQRPVIECAANFSEGRDARIVDAIARAIVCGHGVALLDRTMDPDHNRSVLTFAGSPEAVLDAAVRAVGKAAELIDLTRHTGVHPRLGAADVVPFIPVQNVTLEQCVVLAHRAGEEIWQTAGVPVYFYEAAALRPERTRLENVRRGEFESLRSDVLTNPERRPDVGGPALHPTAGAVIVGARKLLIAFNVNLATGDLAVARSIARRIRTSSGGFPHVKALGLPLRSRGQVQVSMNLTDFEQTPLHVVYEAIRREAHAAGVEIAGSELIGLIPRAALDDAAVRCLNIGNFRPSSVLETRIEETLPAEIQYLLEQVSDPAQATGGGGAAALSGALAAALGILVCRLSGEDSGPFEKHRQFFVAAIERDDASFALRARTGYPEQEAVIRAAEVPLGIAERARALHAELAALSSGCPTLISSTAANALSLAETAGKVAISTARLNLCSIEADSTRKSLQKRLLALE